MSGGSDSHELTAAVPAAGSVVLVVGDVMVDRYVMGTVDRISPEAPVPVLRASRHRAAPGGAANVAAGLAALGCRPILVGAVGEDPAGRRLRTLLERVGVDAGGLVRTPSRPTTAKTRFLSGQQQILRVDRESTAPLDGPTSEAVLQRARAALAGADAVILQDYGKGMFTGALAAALIEAATAHDLPVVVDPKPQHLFRFQGATVVKPNDREAARALGLDGLGDRPEIFRDLRDRTGCRHLLVTRGARGMVLLEGGASRPVVIASRAREVFDVTGAGDTVTATLAAGLAGGQAVRTAARVANAAAGIAVGRLGARSVSREALAAALRDGDAGAGEGDDETGREVSPERSEK